MKATIFNKAAAIATAAATSLGAFAVAAPAFADMNSSYIKIEVDNTGSIQNYTSAKAETGGNWAGGSEGGKGGSGGDVEAEDGDYNNGGAEAGDGGNGGDASDGGWVETGDANADAGSVNTLNTNDIAVKMGYHSDMNSSKLKIELDNGGCECEGSSIQNLTKAKARTGGNDAEGSEGGKGGYGGDVEVENDGDNNNGGADAGNGGDGGEGGIGGTVLTGEATSNSGSVNVLNTNLVRVRI